jgi:hypothetical protein
VTEQRPSSEPETQVQAAAAPAEPPVGASDFPGGVAALIDERPEIGVGAAFAGGLALAMILKRLAR